MGLREKIAKFSTNLGVGGVCIGLLVLGIGTCERDKARMQLEVMQEINNQQKNVRLDTTKFQNKYDNTEYWALIGGGLMALSGFVSLGGFVLGLNKYDEKRSESSYSSQ